MDSLGVKINIINTSHFAMLNKINIKLGEISAQNSFSFAQLNQQMSNISKEIEHILEDTYEIKITTNKSLEAAVGTRKVASEKKKILENSAVILHLQFMKKWRMIKIIL